MSGVRFGGRALRAVAFADALQGLVRHSIASREALETYRDRQVRRLVHFAARDVPFWRQRFRLAGIDPEGVCGIVDLTALPPLEKHELQAAETRDLLVPWSGPERLHRHRTSGATGQPLTLYQSRIEQRLFGLFRKRAFLDMGISPRDRLAWVALPHREHRERPGALRRMMYAAGFYRLRKFSCLEDMGTLAAELRAWQPDVLIGFGATLARLGERMLDEGGVRLRPRQVVLSGEVVTPGMRRTLIEAFGRSPLEMYGSVEFGLIAWRGDAEGPLIVMDDAVVLEVLRDGRPVGPGEEGEVVVTGLLSWSMPLIRYRLGDVVQRAAKSTLRADRWPFEALESVRGRSLDLLTLPDGRRIHSWQVTVPTVIGSDWVRRYRLVQERLDRFVVYVVPDAAPAETKIEALRESVVARLGPGVEVELRLVESLSTGPNGKFRLVESLVHSHYSDESDVEGSASE